MFMFLQRHFVLQQYCSESVLYSAIFILLSDKRVFYNFFHQSLNYCTQTLYNVKCILQCDKSSFIEPNVCSIKPVDIVSNFTDAPFSYRCTFGFKFLL